MKAESRPRWYLNHNLSHDPKGHIYSKASLDGRRASVEVVVVPTPCLVLRGSRCRPAARASHPENPRTSDADAGADAFDSGQNGAGRLNKNTSFINIR